MEKQDTDMQCVYIVRRMHISHMADHWGVDHVAGQRSQSEIQERIHDECYGSYINCLDQVLGKVTTATAILNSKGGGKKPVGVL